jgi:hypothetical protein
LSSLALIPEQRIRQRYAWLEEALIGHISVRLIGLGITPNLGVGQQSPSVPTLPFQRAILTGRLLTEALAC